MGAPLRLASSNFAPPVSSFEQIKEPASRSGHARVMSGIDSYRISGLRNSGHIGIGYHMPSTLNEVEVGAVLPPE
jgi:hypothetical protein